MGIGDWELGIGNWEWREVFCLRFRSWEGLGVGSASEPRSLGASCLAASCFLPPASWALSNNSCRQL
ncbi:MAG: hypothetical protein F6K47_37735 [Symploca sp. SIO2E6]|nr:hypothetical protein [Symploca sp. SIO2E6]